MEVKMGVKMDITPTFTFLLFYLFTFQSYCPARSALLPFITSLFTSFYYSLFSDFTFLSFFVVLVSCLVESTQAS